MKFSAYISKKILQAIFGIVIGLIVLMQASVVPESLYQNATDHQEQSGAHEEDMQLAETPALPSSSHEINLGYQSYLLAEVIFQEEDEEKTPIKKLIIPSAQKVLKVLFRRIISPNAP